MTEPRLDPSIRRVLVALDESGHSSALLEAATELAVRLRAELRGLFVEDINLLRLASLPFARELSYAVAPARRLDALAMERSLRLRAQRLQERLEAGARRAQIPCSFQVARGRVSAEVLARATETDLLILGRAGQSFASTRKIGSIARTVSRQASCTVLLLRQGGVLSRPVLVLFDGSATARRALALAAHLAREDGHNLVVLIAAPDESHAREVQQQAAGLLQEWGALGRFRSIVGDTAQELAKAVRAEAGKVLVLDAVTAAADAQHAALLDSIDCPLVLVR